MPSPQRTDAKPTEPMQVEDGDREGDEELNPENELEEEPKLEVNLSQPSEGRTVDVELLPEVETRKDIMDKLGIPQPSFSGVAIAEYPPEDEPEVDHMHPVDLLRPSSVRTVHIQCPPENEQEDSMHPVDLSQISSRRIVNIKLPQEDEPEDPMYEVDIPFSRKATGSKAERLPYAEKSPSSKSSKSSERSPKSVSSPSSLQVSPDRSKMRSKSEAESSLSPTSRRSNPKLSASKTSNIIDIIKSKLSSKINPRKLLFPTISFHLKKTIKVRLNLRRENLKENPQYPRIFLNLRIFSIRISATSDAEDNKDETLDLPRTAIGESKSKETDDEQQSLCDDTGSLHEEMTSSKTSAEKCSDEPSTSQEKASTVIHEKEMEKSESKLKDLKDETHSSPEKRRKCE